MSVWILKMMVCHAHTAFLRSLPKEDYTTQQFLNVFGHGEHLAKQWNTFRACWPGIFMWRENFLCFIAFSELLLL